MGTPIYNLPYPTDYTGKADVPEWLKDLADATEGALQDTVGDIGEALDTINGESVGE